jgi:hypothetical protein
MGVSRTLTKSAVLPLELELARSLALLQGKGSWRFGHAPWATTIPSLRDCCPGSRRTAMNSAVEEGKEKGKFKFKGPG